MNPVSDARAPVAIVGAGPVGLSLALGLARHGVRSVVFERKAGTSERSKAPAIHIRTREAFRRWGVEERFLEAGTLLRTLVLHSPVPGRGPLLSLDFSELEPEAGRPGLLILEQGETERLLLEAARETGLCEVRFGAEAVALERGAEGVRLRVDEHGALRAFEAEFVVGCDGASSFVRQAIGQPFDGMTYSIRPMLADVRVEDARDRLRWPRAWNAPAGYSFTVRLADGLWRIVRLERGDPSREEVPDEEVHDRVRELLGPGPVEVVWANRFRIHLRSSPRFRVGRVLLAGDAAHIHSPAGGLGMNAGIQDAHNLAWKLAAALRGGDVDRLLDSYDVERRAVAVQSVSRTADLITRTFLQTPAFLRRAAFAAMRATLRVGSLRRRTLRRATMIDLAYPESPLLNGSDRAAGVRLPNVRVYAPGGDQARLYDLLPAGTAILELASERDAGAGAAEVEALPVDAVIRIGPGGHREPGGALRELLGGQDGRMLIRPDAHVAWAREGWGGIEGAVRRALGGLDGSFDSTTPSNRKRR